MTSKDDKGRVVFLDYLRVLACFMVMVIHSCEPFYLAADENGQTITKIACRGDAVWITVVECLCRICVPLFVMASSYLLFPVRTTTGAFLKRRLLRVFVPFLLWACAYVAYFGGAWGKMLFNFPDAGGHLWFVPMLIGLYLIMPLLSPWAEAATEKEVRFWLLLWLATTSFPFLRKLWGCCWGEPPFGAVPYLYGECPWNMFGAFHYVSGFVGYVLAGFWFRRFAPQLSWRKTMLIASPLWLAGVALIGWLFFSRIPKAPFSAPYATAVDMEMGIEYCSTGVALATFGMFMVFRKFTAAGGIYQYLVRPLSEASFGAYLLHMFVLIPVIGALQGRLATPFAIAACAVICYVISMFISMALRKIPIIGKWICG